ncbi:MAG TPA: DUF1345 domain-containing protein [Niabella sp.]|nr:DUF1345 domain-containing protein [Niabella sp.]HQW14026.1 DUF1345 domain-containing protein [Niabella sp.]HQX19431.1 DUF1345 domain-containing protein [Niabella sp.]HQX40216.1 DUF1345 domain-containing protein [Niabella sp.]HRB05648.1 DUF1345 domain-containing protein [Niabella sp.]
MPIQKGANFSNKGNIFHKSLPIHRVIIGAFTGIITFAMIPAPYGLLIKLLLAWISFSITHIILSWVIIYTMPVQEIKKKADKEDGSISYVLSLIILACIASFCAVFFITISDSNQHLSKLTILSIAIFGMLFSWCLVHTVFTFHYARMYYKQTNKGVAPLDFPGNEPPDYIDFAYFSFVLGCTFQVSDVSIQNKKMRHLVLYHGLISFALNTFVIALSINIMSSLIHA